MSHDAEENVYIRRCTKRPRYSFHRGGEADVTERRCWSLEDAIVRSSWFSGDIQELSLQGVAAQHLETALPLDRELRHVKDEVRTLGQQLGLVKERLGPAAQACADAINALSNHGAGARNRVTDGHGEFCRARRCCNPFEVLGEGQRGGLNNLFLNRSAVKLANIDYLLNWRLTQAPPGESTFRFVDLCGAPGGFSEYLIQRCHWRRVPACCGFGMSLLGTNEHGRGLEWRLEPFSSLQEGRYASFQICDGADGTGDIFQWSNVELLRSLIQAEHAGSGTDARVHLVVADGGVDAQRDTNHQEQVTQKLVVCQASAALALLQIGGTFLIKMFGWQTPVVRTLIHHLAALFDCMVALKPICSRPASAERYVIFSGFRGCPPGWMGPQWQSLVFFGSDSLSPLPPAVSHRLDRYLDDFDREMLTLNLRTCHAILSHLERKASSGRPTKGEDDPCRDTHSLTVDAYRSAWQLS